MTQEEKNIQDVMNHLSALEPTAADAPGPARQALARLKRQIEPEMSHSFLATIRSVFTMTNRRMATAVISLVLLFGLALSFPSVRAAASDFLGLFRVQKFAAISVSPEQLALLEQAAEQGIQPGEMEIIREPEAGQVVDSLAEAALASGLQVQTPRTLGRPDDIRVTGEGEGRFIVDLEGARALVEAAGADPALLPDNLDGADVHVVMNPSVHLFWEDGISLVQAASPQVDYPEDLDPVMLGEALLQVLGMNEDEAARLAQDIDWTSTLVLPVPQEFATFSEVTVNGASGLALSNLNGEGAALIWQDGGVIYMLNSTSMDADELVSLANSMR